MAVAASLVVASWADFLSVTGAGLWSSASRPQTPTAQSAQLRCLLEVPLTFEGAGLGECGPAYGKLRVTGQRERGPVVGGLKKETRLLT